MRFDAIFRPSKFRFKTQHVSVCLIGKGFPSTLLFGRTAVMIILLGASGYIGSRFAKEMEERKIEFVSLSRLGTDGYSFTELVGRFREYGAELVINCAAYVGGNRIANCEWNRRATLLANLVLPQRLVAAADMVGAWVGHVSTGCLYQGDHDGKGWSEIDVPRLTLNQGANIYTGSKELAEQVVLEYREIIRVAGPAALR